MRCSLGERKAEEYIKEVWFGRDGGEMGPGKTQENAFLAGWKARGIEDARILDSCREPEFAGAIRALDLEPAGGGEG
jgi:hypothetical protein